jgi:hypothetical protein
VDDTSRLCSLKDSQRSGGTTEVEQATAAGGDVLIMAGTGAKDVTEFVVASTEALRGDETLEDPMVLLQSVVLVCTGWCTTRRPSVERIARG